MTEIQNALTLLVVMLYVFCGVAALAEAEFRNKAFAGLLRRYLALRPAHRLLIGVFVVVLCLRGGSKPTNGQQQASYPLPAAEEEMALLESAETVPSGVPMSLTEGGEPPRLTTNQYAAGFALLPQTFTNAAWLAAPSNAVVHAPWGRYGLAEDTFWLPATNWAFVLGTNAVEGAHVSSSGTLSFDPDLPKGSPRAAELPDGDAVPFLAPLHGALGTVPPRGRFWHAVTPSNSVLMTWQDLYAGRDPGSPVTFQAELFRNGDFAYRYAFTNAPALTNFTVGAQHNGGGETYAFNATSLFADGLELRWRAFGMLDPEVDDHDGDGLSTYGEVMAYGTDPSMPDTDLDGLGDAAEIAAGSSPLARDSDGDGFVDGANPQSLVWTFYDSTNNGLPDDWENCWFGTNGTADASADTNGDGFSDLMNLRTGIDPAAVVSPGFAVTNAVLAGGLDAWEIAPAFALDLPAGATNVLARELPAARTSPWQQFFVSSAPDAAGAWTLDGLELSWRGGQNVSGSAAASPTGDSLRLAFSTNLFDSVTVRVDPSRADGILRSPKPLYLIRWTPQPSFGTSETAAVATASNGVRCVAAPLGDAGADALPFTADASARPHYAPAGEDESAERSMPPDPGSAVGPVFVSGLAAGYLTAATPAEAALPVSGTNPPLRILLYTPRVTSSDGTPLIRPLGALSGQYPLDTPGLRSKWRENPDSASSPGFTVTSGLDGSAYMGATADGASAGAGVFFEWNGSSSCPVAVWLVDPGTNVWEDAVSREPDGYDGDDDDGSGGEDDCECENGSCDGAEGVETGSLKFRIPLGAPGRGQISGFVWLAMEEPQTVTPLAFSVLGGAGVTVVTNGGAVNVSCAQNNGRIVAISNVTAGVLVTVSDAAGALEHTWTVTNGTWGADAGLSFAKRDQAGNAVSDELYTFGDLGWAVEWTRRDRLDGSTGTHRIEGDLEDAGWRVDTRKLYDAGNRLLSEVSTRRDVIGSGDAAVARVTEIWTHKAHGVNWLLSSYWSDPLHPARNGRLRYRSGAAVPWEYRAYDERGREVLRAVQREGCAAPGEAALRADIRTAAGFADALPWAVCEVATFSYVPVSGSGDTDGYEDSRKPRETVRYAVANGAATVVSRVWRVYMRGKGGDDVAVVSALTVRAASAAAAFGDAANASSLSVSYAGYGDASVPVALRDLPLLARGEDGSLKTWSYESGFIDEGSGAFTPDPDGGFLRVTEREGAGALTNGLAGVSTYAVEIRDAAYGRTLCRETRLFTGAGEGPLLAWERDAYDAKGRRLFAARSDGTSESNVWDCCRIQASFARDGRMTDYGSYVPPGEKGRTATGERSIGLLPGTGGRYPVTEVRTDPLGRVTNSVRIAYAGDNPANDPGLPDLATRTEYPDGLDGHSVTADPLGVTTVSREWHANDSIITETATAGVTNRTSETFGGATVEERAWTDPASGTFLRRATRTATSWDGNGCETVTVSVSRNGGGWTTDSSTRRDFLGRAIAICRAGCGGMLVTSNAYDAVGRLVYTHGEDGSATAYAYDALGNPAGTVRIGAGQALQFDPSGFTLAAVAALDAYVLTETTSWKEEGDLGLSAHGVPSAWWDCSAVITRVPGQGAVTASVSRAQLTGLSAGCVRRTVSADADGTSTITAESLDSGEAKTTVKTVNTAAASSATAVTVAGYETARTNAFGGVTAAAYDGFARQTSVTETEGSRTLATGTGYRGDGTVAFTAEICGTVSNVTTYSQRHYLESPEGAYCVTETDALGNETVRYYGGDGAPYRSEDAVYPTETALDADGNRAELRTWRDESGAPDVTRWLYDEVTGLLTNKVYADGHGTVCAYLPDGRLSFREWARGVTTSYGYADTAEGRATTVDYSGLTPDVSNRYDLSGALVAVNDGEGARTFSYDGKRRLSAETNALAVITRVYDAQGRDVGYDLELPGLAAGAFSVRYSYGDGRVDGVSSSLNGVTDTFVYSFVEGAALVAGMTNTSGFGWARSYEPFRNLITAVSNTWGGAAVSVFDYENDAAGRRTLRVDTAQSLLATNAFAYNHRSEVTNAAMGGMVYSYSFDDIGNRQWATAGASLSAFAANNLNQYAAVTNAGEDVPVAYDLDGNMTRNGQWVYAWDGENNMRSVTPASLTNGSRRVVNGYDYLKRRWRKCVEELTGYVPPAGSPPVPGNPGQWVPVGTVYYVWDGWNIAAEVVVDEVAPATNITYYTWGLDLSGSLQGAGGVGGLLGETRVAVDGTNTFFVGYDANGNVTEYVDNNGTVRGHFEYSAFGEITAQSGDLADTFAHRFSTKPFDVETGISKYQQRDYISPLGRWACRDPIEENGDFLLYGFVGNSPPNVHDLYGLKSWKNRDPFNVAMRGANFLGMTFDGANLIDAGGDKSYSSLSVDSLINDVKNYFDISGDGKLSAKDCPPFKLNMTGYSWGAWSVLQVAHSYGRHHKGLFKIRMGLVDPVSTMRSKSPCLEWKWVTHNGGKTRVRKCVKRGGLTATRPENVVFGINYYQTIGGAGTLADWPFVGMSVEGMNINEEVQNLEKGFGHTEIMEKLGTLIAEVIFQ